MEKVIQTNGKKQLTKYLDIKNKTEWLVKKISQLYPAFNSGDKCLKVEAWSVVIDKLNSEQIKKALKTCSFDDKDFPPKPITFIRFGFGLHRTEDAYYFAAKKNIITPAIHHASYQSNMLDTRYPKFGKQAEKAFSIEYDGICERIILGEQIEFPKKNNLLENNNYDPNEEFKKMLIKRYGKDHQHYIDFINNCENA